MKNRYSRSLFLTLTALALQASSHAATLAWGTSSSVLPVGYLSDGSVAGSTLVWTVGYFNSGFTPDASNITSWAANYNQVGINSEILSEGFFTVSASESVIPVASEGKTAYIFAYNDLGLMGLAGGEALLLKEDNFVFPIGILGVDTLDIADNLLNTNDDPFTVIWGQVDRSRRALGGVVTGGGISSNPLADTATRQWEVQTFGFVAIPEPSSTLLLGASALALLARRRRDA